MVKYHITDKGIPKECRARVRPCKYGEHFTTMDSAMEYVDYKNEIKARDKSIYDYLSNQDDVLAYTEEGSDYTTFKYAHLGVNFNDENMRRARGLTFNNKTKEIVTVGFEKFFNHNQLFDDDRYTEEFAQKYSGLDLSKIETIKFNEKMDGSLILVGKDNSNGKLVFSTTGSANSVHGQLAKELAEDEGQLELIKNYLENNNDTLAFELVSPENRIVVNYAKSELVLLGSISKETLKHHNQERVDEIANELGNFKRPRQFQFTKEEFDKFIKEKSNFEGFVVENEYGKLIKIKTEEYLILHRKFSEFNSLNKITSNSVKQVVKEYLDETLDDTIAELQNGNLNFSAKTAIRIQNKTSEIMSKINSYKKLYDSIPETKDKNKNWFSRKDVPQYYKSMVLSKKESKRDGFERSLANKVLEELKEELRLEALEEEK